MALVAIELRGAGMDSIDWNIIDLLRENCRISYSQIAHKLSLSTVAVFKRVSKLRKKNIIRFAMDINPLFFGFYPIKFDLTMTCRTVSSFIEDLLPCMIISELWQISESGYQINAFVRNEMDFHSIKKKLCDMPDVNRVELQTILQSKYPHSNYGKKIMDVLRCLAISPRSTSSEISDTIGLSSKSVRRIINRLLTDEHIKFTIRINQHKTKQIGIIIKAKTNCIDTLALSSLNSLSHPPKSYRIMTEVMADKKTVYDHFLIHSMETALELYDCYQCIAGVKPLRLSIVMKHVLYSTSGLIE
ncbi:MAG: AsnC family transcriptional regulator [Candidatus Thorarchaeota archaeon]|nr:AsnC family transcriptional regulator [Candidatus Thorarchaeota archaeon]